VAKLSEKQAELFRGKNWGTVVTLREDGSPHSTPVWIDTDGENVIFNTTNKRAKGRNLRTNPRVSISVWDNEDPYKYFEVEGPVELDEEGANEHIGELSMRYDGKPFHTPADRVIVRVKPERVLDHGIDD
jgi:PPOX class probable F420-dependent enzyme